MNDDSTLTTVIERVMKTIRADRGLLLLLDAAGAITARVARARPDVATDEDYSMTVARHVLTTGQSLWLTDFTRDERFQESDSLHARDWLTVICVPMRWGDRVHGLIYVDRQEASDAFSEDDLRLVEELAGFGALALERAELVTREAEARLQATRAEERTREREAVIQRILHDLQSSMQGLALMNLDPATRGSEASAVATAPPSQPAREATPRPGRLAQLTDRERELVALVAQGLDNRRIADVACLSEKTVRNYLTTIYEKLGVENRTQAALLLAQAEPSSHR